MLRFFIEVSVHHFVCRLLFFKLQSAVIDGTLPLGVLSEVLEEGEQKDFEVDSMC